MVFNGCQLIASPKGEAIRDCAQGECRTFEIVLICVCLSVNNAARCTLHLLSAMQLVPLLGIQAMKPRFGWVTIVVHACDWLKIDQR